MTITPNRLETVSLRPAQDADFAVVAQLFAELHRFNAGLDRRFRLSAEWEGLLRTHFLSTHNAPGALWLLAWQAATPVGMVLVEAHADSPLFAERHWAELVALYVAEEWRGSGLAQRLVAEAKLWAAAHGFERIQLYVTASNLAAKRFYAQSGFCPTQEIWRCDLQPAAVPLPADPSCVSEDHAAHHIELGNHHLAMELVDKSEI